MGLRAVALNRSPHQLLQFRLVFYNSRPAQGFNAFADAGADVDRATILREVQLSAQEPPPKLGTLAELLDSLATCSPQRWTEKRDALGGQLTRALNLAAQKLEPKVQPISPPHRILRDEADLDAWLAEVRKAVLAKLADGPVQL